MKFIKSIRWVCVAFFILLLFAVPSLPVAQATTSKTYTVTANLFVPGHLNTQLPGVTAYLTNGSNPLGIGGYPAVAPTEPVSQNAKLTVYADGKITVDVQIPNPVFTLQKIAGSSNATVVSAPRDEATYATQDGSVSRTGRITSISVALHDRSGTYVFNDCVEFPTLLGVDWHVPLTLAVDFTGVDFQVEQPKEAVAVQQKPVEQKTPDKVAQPNQQAVAVNKDQLQAITSTVEQQLAKANVSTDGQDVKPSDVWVTKEAVATLTAVFNDAKKALNSSNQSVVDEATAALTAAFKQYTASEKSGTFIEQVETNNGKELAPGSYTVSANIWFNKADTGLPLNPHITNSTFPPYNPVEHNTQLIIAEDGNAILTIPVVIQDKVMTIREIRQLKLLDVKKLENGAISEITVDLGKLSGEQTVITQQLEADIEMGDLAMSISGLTKAHTWPAIFELNLSGVATKDGGVMPAVALQMLNATEATDAMAQATTVEQQPVEQQVEDIVEQDEKEQPSYSWALIIAIVVLLISSISIWWKRKKGR